MTAKVPWDEDARMSGAFDGLVQLCQAYRATRGGHCGHPVILVWVLCMGEAVVLSRAMSLEGKKCNI